MSTDNAFPAFDPSMLSREPKEESTKITWKPDREAIEKALGKYKVKVNMPRVFFSANGNELAQAISPEFEFRDEFIDRYVMSKNAETDEVLIHVYPLIDAPFWLKVTDKGLDGPEEKKSLYLVEKSKECYKESCNNSEESDPIPYTSTAFRIA